MEPIRKSTRLRRAVGTKVEKPKPLNVQPCFEEPCKWDSPIFPCHQQAIHGCVPSNAPDTKRQTERGAYAPSRNKERWATTRLASTASASKPKKKTPEKMQSASPTSRRDSAELIEHKCPLGECCELSTKHKRENNGADSSNPTLIFPNAATEDLEAAISLLMLRRKACRPMTKGEMRTDFVEQRHLALEVHEGTSGHWETDGRWVEESQLKSSLEREAEYGRELEEEGKRRKRMAAMLLAHDEIGD